MIKNLKFTVVTASFNGINTINDLAQSLGNQTYKNFEWIVFDGKSSDGTVEYLEKCNFNFLKYRVEVDKGIYDAFNKAISISTGDYLIFLGVDDKLHSNDIFLNINKSVKKIVTPPMLILGDVEVVNEKVSLFHSVLTSKLLLINSIHHQGALYHKSLFNEFRYNESIRVVADYELNLIAYIKKIKVIYYDNVISVCGGFGISRTSSELHSYKDMHSIRARYLNKYLSGFFCFVAMANVIRRKLFS